MAGGAIGGWLLYIQHQYEDTYYQSSGEWQFELAALQGSSYLQLPRPLAWAIGNTNFHHVHHLSAKIPNYNLRAAHENHPMFRRHPGGHDPQQPQDLPAEAVGHRERVAGPVPEAPRPLGEPRAGPRDASRELILSHESRLASSLHGRGRRWRHVDRRRSFDLDGFLGLPLVARVATVGRTGPSVRPVWYLWEGRAFWWLTGAWSRLGQLLERDPRVALVVDTCDLDRGEVLQVTLGAGRSSIPSRPRERAAGDAATSDPMSATGVASKATSSTIPRRARRPEPRVLRARDRRTDHAADLDRA